MKRILIIIIFCLSTALCFAQLLNPVHFSYTVKKTGDKTYEVHITASMDEGWHIYSQIQPKEAIAIPTKIIFVKNPLLLFTGKIKEAGKKEKYEDKNMGIVQYQYGNKVEFVQIIQLKSKNLKLKTEVNGTIEFQTCTDKMCLPPKTINFSVELK